MRKVGLAPRYVVYILALVARQGYSISRSKFIPFYPRVFSFSSYV
jgi:hypothetical protein